MRLGGISVALFLVFVNHVHKLESYLVGAGLNVRFAQLLYNDIKYQILREEMIKQNTKNLASHCRGDQADCDAALAKMRYKASKHFYALAKAVVDYVKNRRLLKPTGYVGTATFCLETTCQPDIDPPVILGGCSSLIGCGGNNTWHLDYVRNEN